MSYARFRQWLALRLVIILWIVRHDSTALTEILSGLFLIVMRAFLLIFAPRDVLPIDVQFRLYPITENRWAAYIMVLGLLQILLAGSRHSALRLWVKVAIIFGFVAVAVAYVQEGRLFSTGMVSLITLSAFYTALMYRIFRDNRRGVVSLEERWHRGERRG